MTTFIDPYSPAAENGDGRPLHDRHDELGSQSGSDEGSPPQYADSYRNDVDFDDDSDALTSQTLNADGTPKRPMNAFMIFARRRRPQVSAENQAMRTGEISKILSKEWAMMAPSDKQFYLDRAKQLKETFNSKYPDYVYRRRPNNSRKKSKRRLDTGLGGSMDHRNTPEGADDFGISGDYDARHEIEDRHYDGAQGVLQSRPHPEYIGAAQARPNPFAYDPSYRHDSSHDPRVPFITSPAERLPNDAPGTPHRGAHSELYGYMSSGQSQPTSLYPTDSGETHDRWESRVGPGRTGWMHDRPIAPPDRFTAGGPTGWSGAVPPAPTGNPAQPGSFTFPTLTAPFYPSQAHIQSYQATAPPSSQPNSPARYESPASQGPQNTSRDYSTQGYHPTSSVGSESPFSGNTAIYQPRLSSISRGLPSVHSLASYPHTHPGASGTTASQGY